MPYSIFVVEKGPMLTLDSIKTAPRIVNVEFYYTDDDFENGVEEGWYFELSYSNGTYDFFGPFETLIEAKQNAY